MGEAGRQRLLSRFGMERLTAEFEEEYETALRLSKDGPA